MPAQRTPLRSTSPSPPSSRSSRPGTPKSSKGKAKNKKSKAAPANEVDVTSPLDVDATITLADDADGNANPHTDSATVPSTQGTSGTDQQLNAKAEAVTESNIYGKLRGRIYMR